MPGNHVLSHGFVQHHNLPGRVILPGRDGGANRVSQGLLLPPWELRASRVCARDLLPGRFRDFYVMSAGMVRKLGLEQHVRVERRGVRRGKSTMDRPLSLK